MSSPRLDRENSELSACKVLVTRDVRQASDLTARLKDLGADVFEFPLIEIVQPASTTELDKRLSCLQTYDWVIFASTNAVDFFFQRLSELNIVITPMSSIKLAAVGAKTAERVRENGLEVDFCPEVFSASSFAKEFCTTQKTEGTKILWPRTNIGKLNIKELLEEHGSSVDVVIAYETHLPESAKSGLNDLMHWLDNADGTNGKKIQIITLTSSQAVKNLNELLQLRTFSSPALSLDAPPAAYPLSENIVIASIGSETHHTASNLFQCECIQSDEFTVPGLIESIKKIANIRRSKLHQAD